MNTQPKRQKTVFKSKEIAHVWANEGAPHGRCCSNMSFEGDTFKSYSTVIANRIRYKGKVAFVVDNARFSVTTSRHQSYVRQAIPSSFTTFYVSQGSYGQRLEFTPQELRDYYLVNSKPEKDQLESRYAHIRANEILRQSQQLDIAIEVCEFFGLATNKLVNLRCKNSGVVDKALDVQQSYYAKLQLRREEKEKREKESYIARAIRLAEEIKEDSTKIVNLNLYDFGGGDFSLLESRPDLVEIVREAYANKNKLEIEAWRNGKSVHLDWTAPVMLRKVNGNMETSKGAIVDLLDALKAYRFALRMREKGWQRNGEQFQIGMYNLDRVNSEGVIAGCHRVKWDEIERFAVEMKWNQ